MFKSLTEKHRTINHMIIFNDSISFTSAGFEAFGEAYQCFFSICLGKKTDEVITFLGILKKYVSENKLYFCSRKKSNILLNKKVIFVFHTIFKLDFITQIIYCIIHRCLHSLFILFLFSYINFLEREHRNNVNPSQFHGTIVVRIIALCLFIQLAKVQQQDE